MKKFLCSLLCVVLLATCCVAVFAACEAPVDYEHTIIFYSTQGDSLQQVTANAIKNFEEKFPGWKVEHTQAGGYDDVKKKIVSDFQGGIQPDLAYCYADHVALYMQTEKVYDLNSLINSTATVTGVDSTGAEKAYTVGYSADEIADFVRGYYEEGYASNYSNYADYGYTKDSMLTLPFVKSTELLYYNKTALDSIGLDPATTWDELWEQCADLKEKYPTATPLGYDSEANWFITMCAQNGWDYTSAENGKHYIFNNENTKAWLAQLNQYYKLGYITTQEIYQAYTSGLFTKGAEDGGAIYCIGSSGGASHQDPGKTFEWGVAPIPASGTGEGQNAAISQGPSLVMLEAGNDVSNVEEKKIMTFMFMKELLDPTFQASFAIASGYNPSRNSVFDIEAYAEHMEGTSITAKAAEVAASMKDCFFTSPAFVGSSTAREQVGNVIVYALTGKKTPQAALEDAVKNCGGNSK